MRQQQRRARIRIQRSIPSRPRRMTRSRASRTHKASHSPSTHSKPVPKSPSTAPVVSSLHPIYSPVILLSIPLFLSRGLVMWCVPYPGLPGPSTSPTRPPSPNQIIKIQLQSNYPIPSHHLFRHRSVFLRMIPIPSTLQLCPEIIAKYDSSFLGPPGIGRFHLSSSLMRS
ncbi:hypothetical protein FPQ18DRAFT_345087 [Pyronema domesticum]|nr:hypothetical protein FPQ18DRAFT_345087 [Pyronema domesticum]